MPVISTFTAFRDAVRAGRSEVVDLGCEPDAERMARQTLRESGMLLLGECHGVAENAAIIGALVARLEVDTLALEWPVELGAVVDRFLTHGELADHPLWWLGDGRVTAEHLIALSALADGGVARPGATGDRGDRRRVRVGQLFQLRRAPVPPPFLRRADGSDVRRRRTSAAPAAARLGGDGARHARDPSPIARVSAHAACLPDA